MVIFSAVCGSEQMSVGFSGSGGDQGGSAAGLLPSPPPESVTSKEAYCAQCPRRKRRDAT